MDAEGSDGYWNLIISHRELRAERDRHHADFQRISALLDDFFSDDPARCLSPVETLKAIRNIVG